jgi:hypothetical protein
MGSKRQERVAVKNGTKAESKPRLQVNSSRALERRIKVAAAAAAVPVSSYILHLLEDSVPLVPPTEAVGRRVTSQMIQRAAAFRAKQKAPFTVDSVELIREARRERDEQF